MEANSKTDQMIGDRIREILDEKDIPARRIARAIGMPPSTFSNMLISRKDRDYGADLLAEIAQAIGVTVDEIVGPAALDRFLDSVDEGVLRERFEGMYYGQEGESRRRFPDKRIVKNVDYRHHVLHGLGRTEHYLARLLREIQDLRQLLLSEIETDDEGNKV